MLGDKRIFMELGDGKDFESLKSRARAKKRASKRSSRRSSRLCF